VICMLCRAIGPSLLALSVISAPWRNCGVRPTPLPPLSPFSMPPSWFPRRKETSKSGFWWLWHDMTWQIGCKRRDVTWQLVFKVHTHNWWCNRRELRELGVLRTLQLWTGLKTLRYTASVHLNSDELGYHATIANAQWRRRRRWRWWW
jgi:hypothetical protein